MRKRISEVIKILGGIDAQASLDTDCCSNSVEITTNFVPLDSKRQQRAKF